MWKLSFITEHDLTEHVRHTIRRKGVPTQYDLKHLNRNIIDPVKLIFNKKVFCSSWKKVINDEISCQRDRARGMDIGRFHQRIFNYIEGCTVPKKGWDVVFKKDSGIILPDGSRVSTVYVEMKNKHNTTGKGSTYKKDLYKKMEKEISSDINCACFLVEVVAEEPKNIVWENPDKNKNRKIRGYKKIRYMSIDEFYKLVTGQEDAFYQLCEALPCVIKRVMEGFEKPVVKKDSAFEELSEKAESKGSFENALYSLAFKGYIGFPQETEKTFPQEVVKTSTD